MIDIERENCESNNDLFYLKTELQYLTFSINYRGIITVALVLSKSLLENYFICVIVLRPFSNK